MVVGGAAGKGVRKADLLITVETTDQALDAAELFFQYYRENANYLERTYDFVERTRYREIRQGNRLRRARSEAGPPYASAQVEGQVLRCMAGTPCAATDAVHRDQTHARRLSPHEQLDSYHTRRGHSRLVKAVPSDWAPRR